MVQLRGEEGVAKGQLRRAKGVGEKKGLLEWSKSD